VQLGEILADFLPRWRSQLAPDHPLSAFIAKQFREWAARWDGWADSQLRREMLRESLVILRQWQEQLPADIAATLMMLARDANDRGDHLAAEGMGRESWALMMRAYGKESWVAAMPALEVGRSLVAQQRYAEAEPFLVESYPILVKQTIGGAGETGSARRAIIDLYVAWEKPQLARPYMQTRIDLARQAAEAPDADAHDNNHVAYLLLYGPVPAMHDAALALPFAERAVQMSERRIAVYLHNLARCHSRLGELDLAVDLQRQAVSHLGTDDERYHGIIRQTLADYEAAAQERDG
jgi:tetratricopeptide (TPR) repeat protein